MNQLSAELTIASEVQEGRQKHTLSMGWREWGHGIDYISSGATAPKSDPFLKQRAHQP